LVGFFIAPKFTIMFGCRSVCIDIDECISSSTNMCQQNCVNIPGSYSCQCRAGYRLNTDGLSCSGMLGLTEHRLEKLPLVSACPFSYYLNLYLVQRSTNATKDCISVSTAVSTTMAPTPAGVTTDTVSLGTDSVVRVRDHVSRL